MGHASGTKPSLRFGWRMRRILNSPDSASANRTPSQSVILDRLGRSWDRWRLAWRSTGRVTARPGWCHRGVGAAGPWTGEGSRNGGRPSRYRWAEVAASSEVWANPKLQGAPKRDLRGSRKDFKCASPQVIAGGGSLESTERKRNVGVVAERASDDRVWAAAAAAAVVSDRWCGGTLDGTRRVRSSNRGWIVAESLAQSDAYYHWQLHTCLHVHTVERCG